MAGATLHRWSELPGDSPMPRIVRQRIIGERMMISRVRLERGFVVPNHRHENEQFVVVMSGRVRFYVDEPAREIIASPGEVLCLGGNVPHSAEALEDSEILDLFSPVSEKTGIDRA